MTEILSPLDPDLRPYKNRGGKIICYHGWADPAISAYGTLDYFDEMAKAVGGQREADAFARLYLVPGMHHCSGGPGPNAFDMLTAARELGRTRASAPGPIGSRDSRGRQGRADAAAVPASAGRPLPGSGSVDEAANFRCEAPQ